MCFALLYFEQTKSNSLKEVRKRQKQCPKKMLLYYGSYERAHR